MNILPNGWILLIAIHVVVMMVIPYVLGVLSDHVSLSNSSSMSKDTILHGEVTILEDLLLELVGQLSLLEYTGFVVQC